VLAVHERLLAEFKKAHPTKDPTKGGAWYRLLEQARAEVAATLPSKRRRKAKYAFLSEQVLELS
jgi:hypothetical protein